MWNEFSNPAFFISISTLYFIRVTKIFSFLTIDWRTSERNTSTGKIMKQTKRKVR